jgi:hypothetical protein
VNVELVEGEKDDACLRHVLQTGELHELLDGGMIGELIALLSEVKKSHECVGLAAAVGNLEPHDWSSPLAGKPLEALSN